MSVKSHYLVVGHVLWCGGELGVPPHNLVHGVQEVLLCGCLPPTPDGEHARLSANRPDLSPRAVRTQPG